MRRLESPIFDGIREKFGQPAKLLRLLTERQDIHVALKPTSTLIDVNSVVAWHKLGETPRSFPRHKKGDVHGWSSTKGFFHTHRPEYDQISSCQLIEQWACDIQEVYGFACSKSDLSKFSSTDAMVEKNSLEMINEITKAKLAQNLAHKEIRIIHAPQSSDFFFIYQWDKRVFLMNNGGSHHFAAAKFIANRLAIKVPLKGKIRIYSLNPLAIASLRNDFDIFIISNKPDVCNAFREAMKSFKATWLWHALPIPYDNAQAVLLPRNEQRSISVSKTLRQAGIVDLGQYLADLCKRQDQH
ncbi:DUF6685 family protein [Iodobacter fluviatilis]|uniref:Uncharacterized protein n=1 Tax=Iodobacter fluviatilis TaxID=537 RepID=A0A377Q5G2_9NEIS|nr:DUF6685 family protein [Iodobacter fluviatilis]TCU84582.1 hypothetical protein EV682_109107 [Iodobacter fluviatilis]STQ90047.1 Uncharacterised protein [Iodobacter fluviatilis]